MNRNDVNLALRESRIGDFIVRESQTKPGDYAISVQTGLRSGLLWNVRLMQTKRGLQVGTNDQQVFATLTDLIQHLMLPRPFLIIPDADGQQISLRHPNDLRADDVHVRNPRSVTRIPIYDTPAHARSPSSQMSIPAAIGSNMQEYEMTSKSAPTSARPAFIARMTDSWFRPDMTREDVKTALHDARIGDFLVRESKTKPGDYAISIKISEFQRSGLWNSLIFMTPKGYQVGADVDAIHFKTLADVIQHLMLPQPSFLITNSDGEQISLRHPDDGVKGPNKHSAATRDAQGVRAKSVPAGDRKPADYYPVTVKLSDSWFRPTMDRNEATVALRDARIGEFIVRESQTKPGDYAIGIQNGALVWNGLIAQTSRGLQLGTMGTIFFSSLTEFVQHFMSHPIFDDCNGNNMCLRYLSGSLSSDGGAVLNTKFIHDFTVTPKVPLKQRLMPPPVGNPILKNPTISKTSFGYNASSAIKTVAELKKMDVEEKEKIMAAKKAAEVQLKADAKKNKVANINAKKKALIDIKAAAAKAETQWQNFVARHFDNDPGENGSANEVLRNVGGNASARSYESDSSQLYGFDNAGLMDPENEDAQTFSGSEFPGFVAKKSVKDRVAAIQAPFPVHSVKKAEHFSDLKKRLASKAVEAAYKRTENTGYQQSAGYADAVAQFKNGGDGLDDNDEDDKAGLRAAGLLDDE